MYYVELEHWEWVIVSMNNDNGGKYLHMYVSREQHCDTERLQGSRLAMGVASVAVC